MTTAAFRLRRHAPSGAVLPSPPGGVAGLRTWHDFSALTGANDDPVALCLDSSGAGSAATALGTARPLLKTAVVNGLHAVLFDGVDDSMTLGNPMSGASAGTLFMVVKAALDPNTGVMTGHPLMGWGSGGGAIIALYPFTDGQIYDDWGATVRKTTGNPTPSLAAFHIYEVVSAAGAWTNWINGTQHFTTATNTVGWGTSPQYGAFGGFFFNGHLAEVCAYGSALSPGDRSLVRAALGTKYAITVV